MSILRCAALRYPFDARTLDHPIWQGAAAPAPALLPVEPGGGGVADCNMGVRGVSARERAGPLAARRRGAYPGAGPGVRRVLEIQHPAAVRVPPRPAGQ